MPVSVRLPVVVDLRSVPPLLFTNGPAVPELLMLPSNVDVEQAGVVDVAAAVHAERADVPVDGGAGERTERACVQDLADAVHRQRGQVGDLGDAGALHRAAAPDARCCRESAWPRRRSCRC